MSMSRSAGPGRNSVMTGCAGNFSIRMLRVMMLSLCLIPLLLPEWGCNNNPAGFEDRENLVRLSGTADYEPRVELCTWKGDMRAAFTFAFVTLSSISAFDFGSII